MSLWRKKPVVVEAVQWFKAGDVEAVGFYNRFGRDRTCPQCGFEWSDHGVVGTLESESQIVCVGDWIITGIKGERYPCKPDIFSETYEPVSPDA